MAIPAERKVMEPCALSFGAPCSAQAQLPKNFPSILPSIPRLLAFNLKLEVDLRLGYDVANLLAEGVKMRVRHVAEFFASALADCILMP
jgi:hypothetical protein